MALCSDTSLSSPRHVQEHLRAVNDALLPDQSGTVTHSALVPYAAGFATRLSPTRGFPIDVGAGNRPRNMTQTRSRDASRGMAIPTWVPQATPSV